MNKTIKGLAILATFLMSAAAAAQPAAVDTAAPSERANCRPVYPPAALAAKAEGVTSLQLVIDGEGRVASAEVVGSAGPTPEHKLLDQAIVRSLTGCQMFRPTMDAKGQAASYPLTTGFRWQLPAADGSSTSKARPARLNANDPGCQPLFPPAALRAHAQGETRLRMRIDAAGHVASVEVAQSAGDTPAHKLLDEAAAQALSKCPATAGTDFEGKPAGTQIQVIYRWLAR
jgi:TonB family protein